MEGIAHLWLPTHPPYPLLPTHPLQHAIGDITVTVKKFKSQQCYLARRNSYKTLAKRLFQIYSISGVAIYILAQENYSGFNICNWHFLKLVFQNQVTYVCLVAYVWVCICVSINQTMVESW